MSVNSFADELRARSDDEIAQLFLLRPDLLSPVPSDLSSLAARSNSAPSLMRALEGLNKLQLEILTATCVVEEPFSKSEIVSLTDKSAGAVIDQLHSKALIYKDGSKYRLPSNIRNLV